MNTTLLSHYDGAYSSPEYICLNFGMAVELYSSEYCSFGPDTLQLAMNASRSRISVAKHRKYAVVRKHRLPTGHVARSIGSLTERAYRTLRAGVLRGDFKEGMFLTEADAKAKFQIGHTPFREACNRLLYEGLLESMPRRGYFIPQMSLLKVRNLFETRILIESQAIELAAVRATPHQMQHMAALLKQRVVHTHPTDPMDALVRANSEFHRALAEMTQNEEIVRVIEIVLDRAARLVYLSKSQLPNFDVHELHRPIFNAIRKRDSRLARKLLLLDLQSGQAGLFD
jgi:DNA-binding GntR family transcriptional regulator